MTSPSRGVALLFGFLFLAACTSSKAPEPTAASSAATTVSAAAAAPAPPTAEAHEDPPTGSDEIAQSITRVSDTERVITRRGVQLIRERSADLLKRVRFVPEREDGKLTGVRLFGLRPTHPLGRLGFMNGDRVLRVMGKEVTWPELSHEAREALEKATRVVVDINRRGKDMTLVIRVE